MEKEDKNTQCFTKAPETDEVQARGFVDADSIDEASACGDALQADGAEDEWIRSFMQAQRKEIADDGFSRRVMRRLSRQEKRARRLSGLLSAACAAACCYVFITADGFEVLRRSFMNLISSQSAHFDEPAMLSSLILVPFIMAVLAVQQQLLSE